MTPILATVALALAAPASAQSMDHSGHMPGMKMPPAAKPKEPASTDPACSPEHAAMGHCTPKSAPVPAPAPVPALSPACPPEHAAMGHCQAETPAPAETAPAGTALPPGNAPAPVVAQADYADRIWGREAMAPVRAAMHHEHGGHAFSQVILNIAEVRLQQGRDGFRWDGEAWYGGDIHRLTIKSEGEGSFRADAGGEVQALYSRAVGPYFNLQAGVRQDFAPGPNRTYATLGVEGLAPYWFDVEAALFLSDRGDLLGRIEGYYDQRITQRLILQPRAEVNLSAQNVPASRLGSGITDAELGVRLRYEFAREFAPYVGVSWERQFGETARFSRTRGDDTGGVALVLGVRAWF